MDGVDPLPDQDPTEGPNGDESARPSVQPEAGAEYLRNAEADCVHERLGPNRPKSNPALSLATAPRSPAGYTRERLTTRFHTASVGLRRSRRSQGGPVPDIPLRAQFHASWTAGIVHSCPGRRFFASLRPCVAH